MSALEDRLRAAAGSAYPPTPDLAAAWAGETVPHTSSTAHWQRPKRRWIAVALAALVVPAAALAIPAVRRAIGISSHVTLVEMGRLVPPANAPSDVLILHRGRATVTEIPGRYVVKGFTPDTHVRHVRVGADRGVYLTGGHHQLAINRPDGSMIPLHEDRGDALVFERRGTVVRIVGAGSLRAARRIARTLPPSRAP